MPHTTHGELSAREVFFSLVRTLTSRVFLLPTLAVFLGLGISFGAGFGASQSDIAKPHLEVVMYAGQESTAELFYADEFGFIVPGQSLSTNTARGVNNLSFPLDSDSARGSLIQRFDPCVCESRILFQSVRLSSIFYSERIPFNFWVLGGDAKGLTLEGSSLALDIVPATNDPQIFFYANVERFAQKAELITFWVVFGLSGAAILFVVGAVGGLRSLWLLGRQAELSVGRRRRQQMVEPIIPLALAFVAGGVVLFSVAQMLAGAYAVGPTLDEPRHVEHLANYFETGQYSSAAYGPLTALIGHSFAVFLGVEMWGAPGSSAEAYSLRHVAVALIGLLGTGATALTAWLVFASRRWALMAAAVVSSIPLWVGHSMFNIKDIPLATGYALVTTALVALFAQQLATSQRMLIFWGSIFLGLVIGLGTRPGGIPLFLLSGLIAVLLWFIMRESRLSSGVRLGIALGCAAVSAAGAFLALRFTQYGQSLLEGVLRSLDYPWTGFNLYAGDRVTERPGVLQLGEVFLANLPLGIIFLIVAGVVFGCAEILRTLMSGSKASVFEPAFVLVLTQAFAVFIVVAVFDPVVYDGGRQLLFIFPALSLIALFGLYGLMKALPFIVSSRRWQRRTVVGVVGIMLAFIGLEQARFFPYNYSYYNVIAQGPELNGRWQTDYWVASTKEAARFVSDLDPVTCGKAGSHNFNLGSLPPVCPTLQPYVGDGAQAGGSKLEEGEFWVVRNNRTLMEYGPISSDNCRFHSEATRPLRGENVVMSRTYICFDK